MGFLPVDTRACQQRHQVIALAHLQQPVDLTRRGHAIGAFPQRRGQHLVDWVEVRVVINGNSDRRRFFLRAQGYCRFNTGETGEGAMKPGSVHQVR